MRFLHLIMSAGAVGELEGRAGRRRGPQPGNMFNMSCLYVMKQSSALGARAYTNFDKGFCLNNKSTR
jgi:hypothetical protein